MALAAGWLKGDSALDQLKSLDTVKVWTCSGSSDSGSVCMRCLQRRHRAFRLAPIPTGQSSCPGSRASSFRLSIIKHEVIPAVDFCELNCMKSTFEVVILPAVIYMFPHLEGNNPDVVMPFLRRLVAV